MGCIASESAVKGQSNKTINIQIETFQMPILAKVLGITHPNPHMLEIHRKVQAKIIITLIHLEKVNKMN